MYSPSNKLDRMLTKCIRSIEEKGWTVEDCLKQIPSYRTELEPMLRTALRLRQARRLGPSSAFRSNAKRKIRKRLLASCRSPTWIQYPQSSVIHKKSSTIQPRMRLAGSLIPLLFISLTIISAGSGIAYAADNARPGDILFHVDRAIEQIRIQFENDIPQMVRLHLQFASERIKETIELLDSGNTKYLGYALTEYKAQTSGQEVSSLIIETNEMILSQQIRLRNIIRIAPAGVETAIQDTIEDVEQIRKLVMSPVIKNEPVVETTPKPFAYDPLIPSEKSPTAPAATRTPTPYLSDVPPSNTATPGSDITPTPRFTPTPTPTNLPPNGPDLISENIVLEPAIPEVNVVQKITGTIRNQGNIGAGKFGIIFCIDNTAKACYQDLEGDIGIYINFSSLAPGASDSVHTYSWLPDTGGEHILHICADVGHSVSETDESVSSNCTSKTFKVIDSGLMPDLIIDPIDWPTEAYEDDDVIFFYRIINAGTGTARGGYFNQLFIDDRFVPDTGTQVGTRETLTILVPGAVDSHGFVWRATCGMHQVVATTDVNHQLFESDDDNNSTPSHLITVYCHTD
jgi:hypothetical protein